MRVFILRRRLASFSGDAIARRVKAIVIPPPPPRPAFMQPQKPTGMSADNAALMFGLVRKIDRQTGKMHFERRQIKSLMSGVRSKGSTKARMQAEADAKAKARVEALKEWSRDYK
jgi:hypothetical protein